MEAKRWILTIGVHLAGINITDYEQLGISVLILCDITTASKLPHHHYIT